MVQIPTVEYVVYVLSNPNADLNLIRILNHPHSPSPGQRKVMFTCLKRNDKREVKVAQLAGSVGEMSAYHHGEMSLMVSSI